MKTRAWAITDVGLRREHNEDNYLCNSDLQLYAVADGMGGHLGGEFASRMAVEVLEKEIKAAIESLPPPTGVEGGTALDPAAAALRAATIKAAETIHQEAQIHPERTGMGTTLSVVLFRDDVLTICHVGDSRVYQLREGTVTQLTEDHSWIQEQIRAGLITPEDSLVSRFRNIITRSVGFEPTVEPDLFRHEAKVADCYLLCSDGLSNYLDEKEIGEILSERALDQAGKAFVDLANERGGDDNITCVVVSVAESDTESDDQTSGAQPDAEKPKSGDAD